MYILTVFRDEQNTRINIGCIIDPDMVWQMIKYACDRDEFVSFVNADKPALRDMAEETRALAYIEEAVS